MEEELLPPPPKKAQQTEDLLPPPPKKTAGVSAITPQQPQEERSFLGALPLIGDVIHYGGKAVERGFYAGQTADVINPYVKEGEITRESIQDVARYQQEIQKRGEPSFVKEGILMSLAKRPLSTLTELMVESLTSTAVHGAPRIAGGAAIGAGIGLTGLGVGAVPGAATGAMAAGVEAGGNVEYSAKILQSLSEMGVDTTNPDQIVAAFTDPSKTEELRKRALQKAIPIMAFDALSAGIAGKFMSGAIAKGTSKLAAGAKEMGTQMATGAAGEFAGQKTAGEQTDTEAILAEAIGEIGGGTVESITGTVANKPKQTVANKIDAEAGAVPVDVPIAQQQDVIFEEELADLSTFEEELGQPKPVTNAVQEQGSTSVSVGEQTDVVPQVEEGTSETTTQEPTQEGQVVTPEQQEFDAAMAAYMEDPSDQNSNRVKTAQQALQAPAKPSAATVPLQQQINELAKLELGQELTDKARMIIEQSDFPEDTKRELQGLLNVPNMNLNDKNKLVEGLKKAAGIDTTTIKQSTLRDRLRDAWRSGIKLGVKDAETRVKSAIESVRSIISESETSLPARVYKSILSRLNGLNTKNQDKVNALFDYVSRVTESRKVAEQIEAIEDLQEKIKSKKNLLPENQQRLIDALAKVNPTDITDLDEFVQLLNDIAANMITPGKPGRGEPVAFERLNEIARKVNAEYVIAENKRRIDKLQEQDNQFTDEEALISKEDIERGTLSGEIKGLIPSLDKGVGKIKSKQVESLKKLTQAHLDRLSLDELKQLIKGIEQIVKNGDHSLVAEVMPLIDVIQNTHRLDNLKNLAPGSKSAIGKTVAPQRFANLSQVFDYLYNSLSASAAKLAQWSGVRGIVNGAARARSREHEYRVKIDELRKKLEKGKKIDLMSPENMVRLEAYGEFASQMEDTADATMIENALHNWRTSSEYYKKTGDPDNIEVAKIIDQMIKLFDGAKDSDQIRSRMQSAYPDVKSFKEGISNILEELAPEAREAAETLLGKQPLFYKPGTYWPLSVQYTANKPIDSKQYPLGIKLSLPENLIERVAKLKEGTARKIEGVNGVMQSIASSLDAIEVGESRNTANAFLKVDAREDNKYLGAAQTNIALGSLLRESFSEQPGGGFYDRFLNTVRRSAAATVLTGIKSAISQYIPTMTRTAIDFALKRGAQGKAPNLIMNGANTPSAKKLRSNFAISKRGERSLGTYVGDITKIEKSYRGVNKYADLIGTGFDNALRAIGQFIPKYTFNFADTSAAERAWTVAYLDYLDSKGVDISKQSTDEFWANENKLKDEPIRQEAAAAAEQYVSVNQMESGSLETPVVYKKHQLLNAIIPFTKYLTGKATVMNNRAKTLVGGLTDGAFGTPKSTSEETKTAARQLAADYTELVVFHAAVKHLLLYPIQDALVNSYLESLDLEPEDEEKLAKRSRSRKGFSMMEMVTSGVIPIVPLIVLSQMVPDSWKAKAWNGMIEKMAKEPDQPTSEFRAETELPIVPEPKDSQQLLGILGVLESQTSTGQDWRYERIDGDPYIIYKDMKGDTINKAISEEEADALDDGLVISLLSMFGLKDISDVMKQAERIAAQRAKSAKQNTVLP